MHISCDILVSAHLCLLIYTLSMCMRVSMLECLLVCVLFWLSFSAALVVHGFIRLVAIVD